MHSKSTMTSAREAAFARCTELQADSALGDVARELLLLHTQAIRLDRGLAPASAIAAWCQRANDYLTTVAGQASSHIGLWQELLLPHFLRSNFLQRCRAKPRGYAGDYLTVQMMYDAVPVSSDPFGRAVDAWAFEQPCPRAVRNRRLLVRDLLKDLPTRSNERSASVVSLGSGPAAEVFDLAFLDNLRFTLVDIDEDAVAYVNEKATINGMAKRVKAIRKNIIKMALRDDGRLADNQSAFYSLGVIDYFSDDLVVKLLDFMHAKLASGGKAILGNFRPNHPNAALFLHGLDWPLHLRAESDLLGLVAQSRFAGSAAKVGAEAEGVQLFVICTK